jgi:hypothetical protein
MNGLRLKTSAMIFELVNVVFDSAIRGLAYCGVHIVITQGNVGMIKQIGRRFNIGYLVNEVHI